MLDAAGIARVRVTRVTVGENSLGSPQIQGSPRIKTTRPRGHGDGLSERGASVFLGPSFSVRSPAATLCLLPVLPCKPRHRLELLDSRVNGSSVLKDELRNVRRNAPAVSITPVVECG